jgi:hypothetical protein
MPLCVPQETRVTMCDRIKHVQSDRRVHAMGDACMQLEKRQSRRMPGPVENGPDYVVLPIDIRYRIDYTRCLHVPLAE